MPTSRSSPPARRKAAVPAAGPAAEEGGARGGGARQRIFGNGELRDGSAPPSSLPSLFCHDLPTPQPPSRPCAGSSSTPETGRPRARAGGGAPTSLSSSPSSSSMGRRRRCLLVGLAATWRKRAAARQARARGGRLAQDRGELPHGAGVELPQAAGAELPHGAGVGLPQAAGAELAHGAGPSSPWRREFCVRCWRCRDFGGATHLLCMTQNMKWVSFLGVHCWR